MRLAREKHLDHAAPIGNRLTIQAGRLLLVAKRGIADADRVECGRRGIVQKGVHLLRIERLGDQRGDVIHSHVQTCGLHLEQSLKGGQQAILAAVYAFLDCPTRDLSPRDQVEPLQNARHVIRDGAVGEHELLCDLGI